MLELLTVMKENDSGLLSLLLINNMLGWCLYLLIVFVSVSVTLFKYRYPHLEMEVSASSAQIKTQKMKLYIKVGPSPSKKSKFYLLQWKPFQNDEKCSLLRLKSSSRSQDI